MILPPVRLRLSARLASAQDSQAGIDHSPERSRPCRSYPSVVPCSDRFLDFLPLARARLSLSTRISSVQSSHAGMDRAACARRRRARGVRVRDAAAVAAPLPLRLQLPGKASTAQLTRIDAADRPFSMPLTRITSVPECTVSSVGFLWGSAAVPLSCGFLWGYRG